MGSMNGRAMRPAFASEIRLAAIVSPEATGTMIPKLAKY
jgi:hypothetical protein